MKYTAPLALGAFVSSALATPRAHVHRDVATAATTTTTVVVTSTVWVDVTVTVDGPSPTAQSIDLASLSQHIAQHAQADPHSATFSITPYTPPAPSSTTSSSAPPASSAPASPAAAPSDSTSPPAAVQPQDKAVQQAPPPASSSAPAASSPAPATGGSPEDIQNAANAKQEQINNAQKAADFAHQDQMISLQAAGGGNSQPTPVAAQVQAPAASSPSQATPSSDGSGSSGGGSSGNSGQSGQPPVGMVFTGDVTTYADVGAGACGWTMDPATQDYFAIPHEMFGTNTNTGSGPSDDRNAYCGRMATVTANGRTVTGKLTDKCGGCDGHSIDLSQHMFSQLYPDQPPNSGRFHDISWHFTTDPIYHMAGGPY